MRMAAGSHPAAAVPGQTDPLGRSRFSVCQAHWLRSGNEPRKIRFRHVDFRIVYRQPAYILKVHKKKGFGYR